MKPFSTKNPGRDPDLSKIDSLFQAGKARQDEVGKKLLENSEDILQGKLLILYHKDCRSTYCSALHVQRVVAKRSSDSSSVGESSACGGGTLEEGATFTRSRTSTTNFDWKNCCFICGDICCHQRRKTWSMVAVAVHNKPGSVNMYTKMVSAAEKRGDQAMLTRLYGVANGDLVAVEARYHRKPSCYTHYISEKHIIAQVKLNETENLRKEIEKSFVEEFKFAIVEEKQVFSLTVLRSRLQELATGAGLENPELYTSSRTKTLLKQECREVSFIPQPGMTDLVCSSAISVGDALRKVAELVKVMKEVSEETDALEGENVEYVNEDFIVHTAIGILRRRIKKSKGKVEEYYSAGEMTLDSMKAFVDPLLYKAVGWLTCDNLYPDAEDINKSDNLQCLNIACDLTTLATSVMSPKHLVLAILLHHEYGSRKLVEYISTMGYCMSYTELRTFLTSAAIHVSERQCSPSQCFIPPQIQSKANGGKIVLGVGDNWDHNERTVDGKRTTHAMTSILVTPKVEGSTDFPPIPRVSERSLNIECMQGNRVIIINTIIIVILT